MEQPTPSITETPRWQRQDTTMPRCLPRKSNPARAKVGPEKANADFQARPDNRPFTERHPVLLWIALGLVILLLGTVALRSAKVIQTPS